METAQWVFRNVIRAQCAIQVGTLDGRVVAYLAMKGSNLNRLYVDPTNGAKAGEQDPSCWPNSFRRLGSNFKPIRRTMPRVHYMSGMVSWQSNMGSARHLSLRQMLNIIGAP